jgi:broad specificity phosphatase PhoE
MLTTVYLVRHAQSIHNAHYDAGKHPDIIGKLGSGLSPIGVQQANTLAKKLQKISFDAIFSSDFIRAKQTAEIIALQKNLEVMTSNAIRERYWGSLEGKVTKDVQNHIKQLQQGLSDLDKMKVKIDKDMESEAEAVSRLITFLRGIALAYEGKTVLVVAHGNIMRSFLTHLGFARYDELAPGSIENGGYVQLESDGIDFSIKETFGIHLIQ